MEKYYRDSKWSEVFQLIGIQIDQIELKDLKIKILPPKVIIEIVVNHPNGTTYSYEYEGSDLKSTTNPKIEILTKLQEIVIKLSSKNPNYLDMDQLELKIPTSVKSDVGIPNMYVFSPSLTQSTEGTQPFIVR